MGKVVGGRVVGGRVVGGRVVGGRGGGRGQGAGVAEAYHLILEAKFSKRLHCDVGIKSTNVYTWQ